MEVLNIYNLYTRLGEISDKFDVNASLNVGRLNIKLKDGAFVRCGGFTDFATQYNKHCVDVIDITKSYQSGLKFYLQLQDKACELPSETTKVVDEEDVTHLGESPVEAVQEAPDWRWVESLSGSRADKQELDTYAEKFGVKLNKGKKIGNMVADFKEQYNK